MLGELGICFSKLRDEVEKKMRDADTKNSSVADANGLVENFMNDPLLKDAPSSKDMPDVSLVAREAEVGIWIAWAAGRDIAYWKKATAAMGTGNPPWWGNRRGVYAGDDYYEDVRQFAPVLNRLMIISYDAFRAGSMTVDVYGGPHGKDGPTRILNIPALARAGYAIPSLSGANLFLRRVNDVVKFPQQVLPQLDQNPPIYQGKLSRH